MDIAIFVVMLLVELTFIGVLFFLWDIVDCLNRLSYIISTIIHFKSDKEKQSEGDFYDNKEE